MKSLVTSQWLNDNIDNPDLIILDASQTNIESKFDFVQIKGARVFDIKNDFSDTESQFPNTFPSENKFQEGCIKLGINKNSHIVVYDNKGIFNSPRVWWMFKTFGHDNISVLNGGLPDWINQNFETETIENREYELGDFVACLNPNQVKYIEDIKQNITSEECLVVDARSEARFNGSPESRKGLRSGNIPKSVNLPYAELLENGKFKSKEEITKLFSAIENGKKPLIFTCGSGITACILMFAYQLAYNKNASIYDGSWTEWGTLINN